MSRGINFISDEHKFLQSKREPRLFSFNTEDEDVNIKMEFGVPFITVPTKRTIDGLRGFVYNAMQGEIPRPKFNGRALALIGFLCIGFSGVGILMDNFNFNQFVKGKAPSFFFNRAARNDYDEETDYATETIKLWKIVETFDKTLAKYNIDSTACVQHSICVRVQKSYKKVLKNEREASNLDIILEGITRSDWILRFISGTAIDDAIQVGRSKKNCDKVFSSCAFDLQFFTSGIQGMMKNVI
uniref:CSON000712 protein n=1 Tax=Culicoides sonorensis TaxID=179676 RepID=A0A336MF90_CULSO